ncbi:MAG TPA: DUF1343 domain-containing protein [Longimicrobiaceae bacterium]|nr:DUF1343 domain-containing protein [Longimicrobiaceae bacterium]
MPRHSAPRGLAPLLAALALLAGTACRTGAAPPEAGAADTVPTPRAEAGARSDTVLPGLEVLVRDSLHLVRGKRVGLITNQTAVTSRGEHAVDLLARTPGVRLVALFGPEHGVRGNIEGGERIENQRDPATGVPVFSLYGRTQKPTAEMLEGVEVLLFDIQDIGARPYTFVWTMAMAMEAAAEHRIPFVVLDRPNPITGAVDGPLMAREIKTERIGQPITGYYPVPLRHGMTVGEVARYVNGEFGVGARLHVVPADGWRGAAWFDSTGLPWINPSPNIRSLDAALKYAGLVLVEGTNLTVGRGTDAPFSYVGAPWMDAPAVLAAMRKYETPGVRLDTVRLVPQGAGYVPYRGEPVRAIRLTVTDRDRWDPAFTALALLSEVKRLHPTQLRVENDGFTQMLGSRWARAAFDRGDDPREIARRWEAELAEWMPVRERYRMYPH